MIHACACEALLRASAYTCERSMPVRDHTRTQPSSPDDTMALPSRDHRTDTTAPLCASFDRHSSRPCPHVIKVKTCSRSRRSHHLLVVHSKAAVCKCQQEHVAGGGFFAGKSVHARDVRVTLEHL